MSRPSSQSEEELVASNDRQLVYPYVRSHLRRPQASRATASSTRSTITNSALLSSFPQPPPSVDALHAAPANALLSLGPAPRTPSPPRSNSPWETPTAHSRGSRRPFRSTSTSAFPHSTSASASPPSTSTPFGVTPPADAPSSSPLYPVLTARRMSLAAARVYGHDDAVCADVSYGYNDEVPAHSNSCSHTHSFALNHGAQCRGHGVGARAAAAAAVLWGCRHEGLGRDGEERSSGRQGAPDVMAAGAHGQLAGEDDRRRGYWSGSRTRARQCRRLPQAAHPALMRHRKARVAARRVGVVRGVCSVGQQRATQEPQGRGARALEHRREGAAREPGGMKNGGGGSWAGCGGRGYEEACEAEQVLC
ncbi:hypothetical protein C8J57DRAFT_1586304 [Mycena rebaudengoi]|nr:hypothetical protein C8J57DRAFT_1586304 [Mycena rebaudengoi]